MGVTVLRAVLSGMIIISHMWLLGSCNVASPSWDVCVTCILHCKDFVPIQVCTISMYNVINNFKLVI